MVKLRGSHKKIFYFAVVNKSYKKKKNVCCCLGIMMPHHVPYEREKNVVEFYFLRLYLSLSLSFLMGSTMSCCERFRFRGFRTFAVKLFEVVVRRSSNGNRRRDK